MSVSLYINVCNDLALSLQHASNNGFSTCAASGNSARLNILVHVLSLAPEKAFIGFNAARKRIVIFVQHQTDLREHAPCRLVGHARLALKLFRRDTATCRGHEIDRVEPCTHRSRGLVIDRVGGRMDVMPAELARVRLARGYLMVLRDRLARLAKDTIGIKVV